MSDMYCNDCGHQFSEFDALNASLCPDEFNIACPKCENDWISTMKMPHEYRQIVTIQCAVCGKTIKGLKTRKTCSDKCRKTLSRKPK